MGSNPSRGYARPGSDKWQPEQATTDPKMMVYDWINQKKESEPNYFQQIRAVKIDFQATTNSRNHLKNHAAKKVVDDLNLYQGYFARNLRCALLPHDHTPSALSSSWKTLWDSKGKTVVQEDKIDGPYIYKLELSAGTCEERHNDPDRIELTIKHKFKIGANPQVSQEHETPQVHGKLVLKEAFPGRFLRTLTQPNPDRCRWDFCYSTIRDGKPIEVSGLAWMTLVLDPVVSPNPNSSVSVETDVAGAVGSMNHVDHVDYEPVHEMSRAQTITVEVGDVNAAKTEELRSLMLQKVVRRCRRKHKRTSERKSKQQTV